VSNETELKEVIDRLREGMDVRDEQLAEWRSLALEYRALLTFSKIARESNLEDSAYDYAQAKVDESGLTTLDKTYRDVFEEAGWDVGIMLQKDVTLGGADDG